MFEAREKARWARNHYDSLCPEIESFHERDGHRIAVEIETRTGEYIFRVFDLPAPELDWGLRIGDCIHNARAALDYLMVRLYALATRESPRNIGAIQFPVCDTREKWKSSLSVQRFLKEATLSGCLARIEELQPFNERNPVVWGPKPDVGPWHAPLPLALSKLSAWDNMDKHRVIHATPLKRAIQLRRPSVPPEFHFIGGTLSSDPLQDGAELGRWHFQTPLPFVWEPSEMDVKRHFPIEVAIEETIAPRAVLQVLPLCLWGVNQVLEIFEPVFSTGQPPLPVTSIR